jgi:hypothetical protein
MTIETFVTSARIIWLKFTKNIARLINVLVDGNQQQQTETGSIYAGLVIIEIRSLKRKTNGSDN